MNLLSLFLFPLTYSTLSKTVILRSHLAAGVTTTTRKTTAAATMLSSNFLTTARCAKRKYWSVAFPSCHRMFGTSAVCTTQRYRSSSSSSSLSSSSASSDATIKNIPEKHIKSYTMNGTGEQNSAIIHSNTGHELTTDIPKSMGGRNTGPQPVEHLLAAFLGCTQATAQYVGRNMEPRMYIQRMEFENVKAFRDERGALQLPISMSPDVPSRLQAIQGTVKVYLDTKRMRTDQDFTLLNEKLDLLKEQTETRCPVANMMEASGCRLDLEWILCTDDENNDVS